MDSVPGPRLAEGRLRILKRTAFVAPHAFREVGSLAASFACIACRVSSNANGIGGLVAYGGGTGRFAYQFGIVHSRFSGLAAA